MSDPKRLELEETDARYDAETEAVRLDARIGHARLEVIVAAEAIEELVGEAPLSAERLLDGAAAYRVQIADVARRKAGPTVPVGGALLLTGRDVPKRSAKPSGSVH
ncbi:hypothetical protein CKO28_23130 [Rhodovibrio sodomensis]|uniref:Uncharacterized protein n=1 Tax=Rhodovibrio sodomensis TaxID=1088 RepID=A0ABS1DMF1_9PROT|nr:DUF1488 family protein [Rhodovibrio sodomensis]MBK1670909.1 hypothetical protein [Rhodovibrio sodomensis]